MAMAEDEDEAFLQNMTASQRQHTPLTNLVYPLDFITTSKAKPSTKEIRSHARRRERSDTKTVLHEIQKSKIFNDPVHGHIRIPGYCVEVENTSYV